MKRVALLLACIACGSATKAVVSVPRVSASSVVVQTPKPRPSAVTVVVTGSAYGGLALWRPSATGSIEVVAFPWANLSIIDTLQVSPDGRDVAYVEGGSNFGPLVVRALADGSKTTIAAQAPGKELLAIAWSPDGRKLLYAIRRPSSYFVFDREDARSAKIDVPGELAAWLPSGEVVIVDDDGALFRIDHGTKTPIASGPYRHDEFSLDARGHRLLSTGWDETSKRNDVLALDLTTWTEKAIAPAASYATYLWPSASPSGKRVAWLATSHEHRVMSEALVVDGKKLVAPSRDLVGFAWIDDDTLVAHYADRLDVVDANDGTVKGSQVTGAHDTMR